MLIQFAPEQVTAYMTGEMTVKPDDEEKLAAGRLFLQGHTKTGPFLERGNKPGDYLNSNLKKSQGWWRPEREKYCQSMISVSRCFSCTFVCSADTSENLGTS